MTNEAGKPKNSEWDLNSIDGYGIPDIIASVNLDCVVMDKVKDLNIYQ